LPREGYDHGSMNRRWLPFRAALAILVVLSLSLVLIHWHQDSPGQDCGLCATQHMPTLQSTPQGVATEPVVFEWWHSTESPASESSAFLPAHPGRAPPSISSI
jgi:hypothetical protein